MSSTLWTAQVTIFFRKRVVDSVFYTVDSASDVFFGCVFRWRSGSPHVVCASRATTVWPGIWCLCCVLCMLCDCVCVRVRTLWAWGRNLRMRARAGSVRRLIYVKRVYSSGQDTHKLHSCHAATYYILYNSQNINKLELHGIHVFLNIKTNKICTIYINYIIFYKPYTYYSIIVTALYKCIWRAKSENDMENNFG